MWTGLGLWLLASILFGLFLGWVINQHKRRR